MSAIVVFNLIINYTKTKYIITHYIYFVCKTTRL